MRARENVLGCAHRSSRRRRLRRCGPPHPNEKKAKKQTPTVAAPSEVAIKLSKDGKQLLGSQLGKACPLDAIPALVVKFEGRTADVVPLPHEGCRVTGFSVPAEVGTLAPR